MSINVPTPPEGSLQVIETALHRFRKQPNFAASITSDGAVANSLSVAVPHPVYFVGLKDLAKGKLFSAVKLKGWRYLLLNENEPYAIAELNFNRKTGSPIFSHVNYGALVKRTVSGLAFAENLETVNQNDYELRLIDIPSLYVVALWLHAHDNFIIPLMIGSDPINTFTVYTEREFIDLLQDKSIILLGFDETASDKQSSGNVSNSVNNPTNKNRRKPN
jgi:hypothetical protein